MQTLQNGWGSVKYCKKDYKEKFQNRWGSVKYRNKVWTMFFFFFYMDLEALGRHVYTTLCYFLRGQNKIVLCVASSEIASLLLIGGRTSHSTFKIPNKIHESSTCAIARNYDLAELIQMTDLVIWGEAPMQHRHIHEAVNRTLKTLKVAVWSCIQVLKLK